MLGVPYIVQGMSLVELFCLVSGGVNGKSLFFPIDQGVGLNKLRKSKDDVFLSTVHYMKENLVGDSSSLDIEGGVEMDVASFVCSSVSISDRDGVLRWGPGSQCFLTNSQSMQEIWAPESIRV